MSGEGRSETPDWEKIDRLAAIYERQIMDLAPVWETEFEGGSGLVVSVSDAARALAHFWAGLPADARPVSS